MIVFGQNSPYVIGLNKDMQKINISKDNKVSKSFEYGHRHKIKLFLTWTRDVGSWALADLANMLI